MKFIDLDTLLQYVPDLTFKGKQIMYRKMKGKFCLFLILMVSAGCVETINMESNEKNPPVAVNCILRGENRANTLWDDYSPTPHTQSLTLRYVKGKSEKSFIAVEDAVVYLMYVSVGSYKEETQETLQFSYVGNGLWESERPVVIEPETEYSLYVEIPGRDVICAETVSPPVVYFEWNKPGTINDNEEELFLHNFRFSGGGTGLKGYAAWIFAQEYSANGWIDLDYIVTNNPYADDFNVTLLKYSDLEISGESRDMNDYYLSYYFEGGRTLAPTLPVHDKFVRIYNLESESFSFVQGGPIWYLNLESNDYYGKGRHLDYSSFYRCQCHFLSKDLDVFFRNIYLHENSLDNYLTAVYSNPNIYSNIRGGIGIFGCDCVSMLPLSVPGAITY